MRKLILIKVVVLACFLVTAIFYTVSGSAGWKTVTAGAVESMATRRFPGIHLVVLFRSPPRFILPVAEPAVAKERTCHPL